MKTLKNKIIIISAIAGMAFYVLSGFRVVLPDELGVILTFGKAAQKPLPPGIHYCQPYPVGTLIRVKVNEVKRVYVGKIGEWKGDEMRTQLPEEMEYLTGDVNILNIKMLVQYKITNPVRYLFAVRWIDHLIEFLAETELHRIAGSMKVDDVLTSNKSIIQVKVRERLQIHMDSINSGIRIVSAQFRDVSPPYEVEDSFNDVWAAKQDREKLIYQSRGQANELAHTAKGESVRITKQTEAEQLRIINLSKGESKKFTQLEKEYRKSPGVTRERIYIEKMEKILAMVAKVISG